MILRGLNWKLIILKLFNICLLRLNKAKVLLLWLFKRHSSTRTSIFENILSHVSLSFRSFHRCFKEIHLYLRHHRRFFRLELFWLGTHHFEYLKVFGKLLQLFDVKWKQFLIFRAVNFFLVIQKVLRGVELPFDNSIKSAF